MSKILFIDPVCNKPYSGQTLRAAPLGGTEATVVRIAEALGVDNKVTVMQHNRTEALVDDLVTYLPTRVDGSILDFDSVIVLRSGATARAVKRAFPALRVILWLHDLPGKDLLTGLATIDEVVTVSGFHTSSVVDYLLAVRASLPKRISHIYNPIDDNLKPSQASFDRNKLVWFSSPHKGLTHALALFACARRINPEFRLYVSNPGYFKDADISNVSGVVNLSALPHAEAISHVRDSLCVFYPNTSFPETFGLVLAEANAVGTPVLTCPIGAAREVLDNPNPQLVDGRDIKCVVDRLMAWHGDNRPTVSGREIFRTSVVAKAWQRLLMS